MNNSIGKRILYSFMAITTTVLLGVSFGLSFIIKDYFWFSRESELIDYGQQITKSIQGILENKEEVDKLGQYLRSMDDFVKGRIWLVDTERNIIASSRPLRAKGGTEPENDHHGMNGVSKVLDNQRMMGKQKFPEKPERLSRRANPEIQKMLDQVFLGNIQTLKTFHPYFDEYVVVVGLPIFDGKGNVAGALLLNKPVRGMEVFLVNIYYYIAGVGLLALLFSWWLSRLLSRRIVQPLVLMRESAAAMAQGDYSRTVEVKGQDELADLARSLNLLAKDLASFVEKTEYMEQLRRDFVANISHELRTPITIIRGYNEAMLDGTITNPEQIKSYQMLISDETIRLEKLVRELLDISRLRARVEKLREDVPLDVIVGEVVEKLMVKAREKSIELKVTAKKDCYVRGIGDRLIQMVMILTDNAIKYTKEGGQVELLVEKTADARVRLMIVDNGIGIAQEEQALVWERFYKVDKSHTNYDGGSGLGLPIAKEIIDMHGAQLVLTSVLGQGTKIELFFPAL